MNGAHVRRIGIMLVPMFTIFPSIREPEDCSSFHKTSLLRRCLNRRFFNITWRASLSLYLSGSHDLILMEYKDLGQIKPIFVLLPPLSHNHTLC
ncbi:hypothetical protein Hanom_Chr12g01160571 [Helianthus anomalus]